jgi:hypothetical protein
MNYNNFKLYASVLAISLAGTAIASNDVDHPDTPTYSGSEEPQTPSYLADNYWLGKRGRMPEWAEEPAKKRRTSKKQGSLSQEKIDEIAQCAFENKLVEFRGHKQDKIIWSHGYRNSTEHGLFTVFFPQIIPTESEVRLIKTKAEEILKQRTMVEAEQRMIAEAEERRIAEAEERRIAAEQHKIEAEQRRIAAEQHKIEAEQRRIASAEQRKQELINAAFQEDEAEVLASWPEDQHPLCREMMRIIKDDHPNIKDLLIDMMKYHDQIGFMRDGQCKTGWYNSLGFQDRYPKMKHWSNNTTKIRNAALKARRALGLEQGR